MNGSDPADRLGPLSRDVLWALLVATDDGEGVERGEITALIAEVNEAHEDRLWQEEPPDMAAEIEAIIRELENRGYLYEASDGLRVTDRDVLE